MSERSDHLRWYPCSRFKISRILR